MRATCLLSLGLVSLTATPALADGRAVFSNRVCTLGSLAVCVSVRMATVTYERPDGSLGTHVVLSMANLSGWDNNATAQDSYIEQIRFKTSVPVPRERTWDGNHVGFTGDAHGHRRPTYTNPEIFGVRCLDGSIRLPADFDDECAPWVPGVSGAPVPYRTWILNHSVVDWEFHNVTDPDYTGWFVGCDRYARPSDDPSRDSFISTCRGWAIIKFDLPFAFSADDIEGVGFWARAEGTGPLDIAGCGESWNDIPELDVPCNTIPEPFTIALLGSGLAAMGGVGALRRRRKTP